MKQDSIFYDDYDMKLKELLESMRTYPSLSILLLAKPWMRFVMKSNQNKIQFHLLKRE